MLIIIDNYDSFTYNLYQALAVLTNEVKVFRNDKTSIREIKSLNPKGIILSPGPGHPNHSGICLEVIKYLGEDIPILGVCLGHQAITLAFGGDVIPAQEILHGKASLITHVKGKLFKDIAENFSVGRYHSLVAKKSTFPQMLTIEAEDEKGTIMALSHKEYPIYGVQFHPESILTPDGETILKNFVELTNVKCEFPIF